MQWQMLDFKIKNICTKYNNFVIIKYIIYNLHLYNMQYV